jgi:hypothetical protein
LKSENVQCDILPASNDSEHIIIPIFSSVYILPISPFLNQKVVISQCSVALNEKILQLRKDFSLHDDTKMLVMLSISTSD